jgi:hypothetical protein
VLLRRNIVIDVETTQLAAAVLAALQAYVPSGRRADARVFLLPTTPRNVCPVRPKTARSRSAELGFAM